MAVTLTEKAAAEVKRMIGEKKLAETSVLRVGIAAGGCSGFEYRLDFADAADEEKDVIEEIHGVRVAVDKRSADMLRGTQIDFHEDLMSRSFVFKNPLAVRTCGCGHSFQA